MLKSQSILNWFCSNFEFYISGPNLTKYIIPHQISTNPQLQISKSQIIKMLISQSIFHRFESNFGFYISWPILTKYIILHQISTNPTTSNIKISNASNAFISVNNNTPTTDNTMAVKTKNYSTVTSHSQFTWMKRSFADIALCVVHFWINHWLSLNIWYLNIQAHKSSKLNYIHLCFWVQTLFVLLTRILVSYFLIIQNIITIS